MRTEFDNPLFVGGRKRRKRMCKAIHFVPVLSKPKNIIKSTTEFNTKMTSHHHLHPEEQRIESLKQRKSKLKFDIKFPLQLGRNKITYYLNSVLPKENFLVPPNIRPDCQNPTLTQLNSTYLKATISN